MSGTGKFSTHHVPDDGAWYTPGGIVRIDESSAQVRIIKDPDGGYEIFSCRHATEYTGAAPLLRVGFRRVSAPAREEPSAGVLTTPTRPRIVTR